MVLRDSTAQAKSAGEKWPEELFDEAGFAKRPVGIDPEPGPVEKPCIERLRRRFSPIAPVACKPGLSSPQRQICPRQQRGDPQPAAIARWAGHEDIVESLVRRADVLYQPSPSRSYC